MLFVLKRNLCGQGAEGHCTRAGRSRHCKCTFRWPQCLRATHCTKEVVFSTAHVQSDRHRDSGPPTALEERLSVLHMYSQVATWIQGFRAPPIDIHKQCFAIKGVHTQGFFIVAVHKPLFFIMANHKHLLIIFFMTSKKRPTSVGHFCVVFGAPLVGHFVGHFVCQ